MRLIKCQIENFGKLSGFSQDFSEGLNQMLAPNGFGKTTFAAFIRAMFYGLEYTTKRSLFENERKRYLPWQGGRYGGSLDFETGGKKYRIERFFGEKDKEDTFCLYDLQTNLESQDYSCRIGEEIFHLDREAYGRSAFIPQEDLTVSMNDSINSKLTNLVENTNDINNYKSAIDILDKQKKELIKTGEKGRIWEIKHLLAELSGEIEQAKAAEENVKVRTEQRNILVEQRSENTKVIQKIKGQIEKQSEYEALRAQKNHYTSLCQNVEKAENKLRETVQFFPKERISSLEGEPVLNLSSEEINQYFELEVLIRNRENSLSEETSRCQQLEYQCEQKEIMAQAPVRTNQKNKQILFVTLAILAIPGGIWYSSQNLVAGMLICLVGILLAAVSIAISRRETAKKREYEQQEAEKEKENLQCRQEWEKAKEKIRAIRKLQEQETEQIRNFVSSFPGLQTGNFSQALAWIQEKRTLFLRLQEELESQRRQLAEFQAARDAAEEEAIRNFQEESDRPSLQSLRSEETAAESRDREIADQISIADRKLESLLELAESREELERQREQLQEELSQSEEKYKILEHTSQYMEKAREKLSTSYMDTMNNGFADYFTRLGSETSGQVYVDARLKTRVEVQGSRREVDAFSTGCRDLIHICTRLALIDALFQNEIPFVVMDDPFANLDGDRMENARELLQRTAEKYQILYLTCHESRNVNGHL